MKTKIFHILVEGYGQPEYWMHLDLPGNAALADLDSFYVVPGLNVVDILVHLTLVVHRTHRMPK